MKEKFALSPVVIAKMEDLPAWYRLTEEVEPLFGPMIADPAFQQALQNNIERGTAFCIREAGGPPGAALLGGLLFSPKPPVYTIGWLAVTQRARRQEVGQQIVEYVLHQVKPPAEIVVTTFGDGHPAGEPARRFYRKMGFQVAEPMPDGPEGGPRQNFRLLLR